MDDFNEDFEDSSDEETMLNFDRKDTKVWLVKVPKFLADKWESLPGEDIGKVRIYKTYHLILIE